MHTLRNLSLSELARLWSYCRGLAESFSEHNPPLSDFWSELAGEVAEAFHHHHLCNTERLQEVRLQQWIRLTR